MLGGVALLFVGSALTFSNAVEKCDEDVNVGPCSDEAPDGSLAAIGIAGMLGGLALLALGLVDALSGD